MREGAFNKRNCTIVATIIVLMMVIGSFFDYQISCALYNESSIFGRIFAAFGQFPASLGIVIAATLMIMATEKKLKLATVLSYAGGAVLILFGAFMAFMDPLMYLADVPKPVLIIITLVILVAAECFAIRFIKGTDKKAVKQFVKFTFFVIVVQMVVINIVKIPWARPRMRMIAVTPEAAFQPWWVIGSGMKEALTAIGVASEEFKSFPSGHTGCASSLLVISVLPTLNKKLKGKENLLFWIGFAFAAIVAFSRIILGAHFLTDVTVGFSITLLTVLLGYKLLYGK